MLEDLGLPAALRSLVTDWQEAGQEASLQVQDLVTPLPREAVTTLYRITQEALRNAAKHATHAPVHIRLCEQDGGWHLAIEDAGPGFEGSQARAKGGGLGLLSMQERARLVGGTLLLRTALGRSAGPNELPPKP